MTQSKVYKFSTISILCYIIRSRRKGTEEEGEKEVGMGRRGRGGNMEEKRGAGWWWRRTEEKENNVIYMWNSENCHEAISKQVPFPLTDEQLEALMC